MSMAIAPAATQPTPTKIWNRTTARNIESAEGTGTPNTLVVSPGMRLVALLSCAHQGINSAMSTPRSAPGLHHDLAAPELAEAERCCQSESIDTASPPSSDLT